jgi:LytS/YehU family sensor histidine kinase
MSFYKTIWLTAPITAIASLIYMQLFWNIAPIPSAMYPAVSIFWPVQVINKSLWVTGRIQVGSAPMLILGSLAIGVVLEVLAGFFHAFSFVSLVVGTSTPIPTVFTVLLGGIIGKILSSRLGEKTWKDTRSVVAAGIFLGESLIIVLAVALSMIIKSMWVLPY